MWRTVGAIRNNGGLRSRVRDASRSDRLRLLGLAAVGAFAMLSVAFWPSLASLDGHHHRALGGDAFYVECGQCFDDVP